MKSVLISVFFCLPIFLLSQAPQGLSYQAIAWDKYNLPKANQEVFLTFHIRALQANGTIEYTEFAKKTTDGFGLFVHKIGEGDGAKFAQIDWSRYPKYLQVIVDGKEVSTTQLLSVPYAMFAEQSNMVGGAGVEVHKDSIKNSHKLQISDGVLQLGTSSSVVLPKIKVGTFVMVPGGTFTANSIANIIHRVYIGIKEVGQYLVLVNLNYTGNTSGRFNLASFDGVPPSNLNTFYDSQSFNVRNGNNQFWAFLNLPADGWIKLEHDRNSTTSYNFSISNASMALIRIK